MNARQLTRELRRIARREVPDGEPNLWPAIRSRIAPASPGSRSAGHSVERSSRGNEVSSVYVWSADERRRGKGNGIRLLAAGLAVVLVVSVLAVVLGNRGGGGNNQRIAAGGDATSTTVAGLGPNAATPTAPSLSWNSTGKLTIPLEPLNGSDIQASIDAQILPSGDLRLSTKVENSVDIVTWHVVTDTCASVSARHEQDLSTHNVVPSFLQYGWFYTFIPAAKTHQPLSLVVFKQRNGMPVGCTTLPTVPKSLAVAFQPANQVPDTCAVTLPAQPAFAPPDGYSLDPSHPLYGDYWYGTSDLWIGLPLDGTMSQNVQLFWWSDRFSMNAETHPELLVSATLLGGVSTARQPFVDHPTGADGAMLVGVTFPASGCWKVTGTYKGHSLSFVVWVPENSANQFNQAPGPMPAQSPTPSADGLVHTDQQCRATSFGPASTNPSDVNVELRGVASTGQFWALVFQPPPLQANKEIKLGWKIDSTEPLTLVAIDTEGNQIEPSSGPFRATSSNWPRPGTEWASGFIFPHAGCWHIHAQAGSVTGDIWFEVVSQQSAATPVPATAAPAITISECVNTGAADLLNQFVDAFNRNDDTTLKSMLVESPLSQGSWLAAVTGTGSNTTGDIFATTRVDFLNYLAQRHLQHEELRVDNVLGANTTWLPGFVNVVADIHRTANDLSEQTDRVDAMISCEQRQVGSWSLGATVDTANAANLTGDALIEDTLRQRPLRVNSVDMTGGVCPADTKHSVNPNLGDALGDGPLYVVIGADPNGVVHIAPDGQWVKLKVVWTSDPSYQGPVLIRGAQVDGPNALGFDGDTTPEPDLYFTAPTGNVARTGYIRVKATGCYAIQVDGVNFVEIIVIDVQL